MYEAADLLNRIDHHTAPILIGFGIAMLLQTVWLVDALRIAGSEQRFSIPIFCTFLWFAHDLGAVIRFDDWFNVYDHWFMKLFWLGLLSALLLELVFFAQILKYGRGELLPSASPVRFAVLVFVGALGTVIAWEYLRSLIGDPLYLASPAPTMVAYGTFGAALYIRRGSAIAQTSLMWGCFTAMTVAWWGTSAAFFTDNFRAWQHLAMGVFAFGCGVAMTAVIARARRREGLG